LNNLLAGITNRRRSMRLAIVLLSLLALTGPWTFEQIMVPSQYECTSPYVRLEGDFCGYPFSGLKALTWLIVGSFHSLIASLQGTNSVSQTIRVIGISVLALTTLLPIGLSFGATLSAHTRVRTIWIIGAWVLALPVGFLSGISHYPKFYVVQWGTWLFLITSATALSLEVASLRN